MFTDHSAAADSSGSGNAHLCPPKKTSRVSTDNAQWKQKLQEILDAYASTVEKLSDEAVITMHKEHLRLRVDELAAVTEAELYRRGLPAD